MTAQRSADANVIMNTLGRVAGAVFPRGIPRGIRITLLSEPHRGLGMMMNHEDYRHFSNRQQLVELIGQLPRWFGVANIPLRGITEEHHREFWDGFHENITGDITKATRLNILRSEIPLGGFGRLLTDDELADIRQAGHTVSDGARVIRAAPDMPALGSVWTRTHEQELNSTDITVGTITTAPKGAA